MQVSHMQVVCRALGYRTGARIIRGSNLPKRFGQSRTLLPKIVCDGFELNFSKCYIVMVDCEAVRVPVEEGGFKSIKPEATVVCATPSGACHPP